VSEVIKATLSGSSFRKAGKRVKKYREELLSKVELFVKKMAERGVDIAKVNVAVDTGELRYSIDMKPGEIIKNGSQWIIFTGCPHAAFIEFGTGVHTNTGADVNPSVERINPEMEGGIEPNPFMLPTILELAQGDIIAEIAKEVFG
jgi:hypothetical protein